MSTHLTLTGELTVKTAAETFKRLQEALQEGTDEIIIDIDPACSADLTLLQLLRSATNTATEQKRSLVLRGIPGNLRELIDRSGVTRSTDDVFVIERNP